MEAERRNSGKKELFFCCFAVILAFKAVGFNFYFLAETMLKSKQIFFFVFSVVANNIFYFSSLKFKENKFFFVVHFKLIHSDFFQVGYLKLLSNFFNDEGDQNTEFSLLWELACSVFFSFFFCRCFP